MSNRVVVLGGGIGGMTAAQELSERGFRVDIFELKVIPGGKSRTIPVPNDRQLKGKDLADFKRERARIDDLMRRHPVRSAQLPS